MAPRPICPTCGSRRWTRDASTRQLICDEGHILASFLPTTTEHQGEGAGAGGYTRKFKRTKVALDDEAGGQQSADGKWHGDRAQFLLWQAVQLTLRRCVHALTSDSNSNSANEASTSAAGGIAFPKELERAARDLFALYALSYEGERYGRLNTGKPTKHKHRGGGGGGGDDMSDDEDVSGSEDGSDDEGNEGIPAAPARYYNGDERPVPRAGAVGAGTLRRVGAARFRPRRKKLAQRRDATKAEGPAEDDDGSVTEEEDEEDRARREARSDDDEEDESRSEDDVPSPPSARSERESEHDSAAMTDEGQEAPREEEPKPWRRGPNRRVNPRKALSIDVVLAMTYLSCLALRLPVFLNDIVQLAASNKMPYLETISRLPQEMRLHVNAPHTHLLRAADVPRSSKLRNLVLQLADIYAVDWHVHVPPVQVDVLLSRITSSLALPARIYDDARALLDKLPFDISQIYSNETLAWPRGRAPSSYSSGSSSEGEEDEVAQERKRARQRGRGRGRSARFEHWVGRAMRKHPPDALVAAVVLLCLKLAHHRAQEPDERFVDDWTQLVRMLASEEHGGGLAWLSTAHRRSWETKDVPSFTDREVDDFLSFAEQTLVPGRVAVNQDDARALDRFFPPPPRSEKADRPAETDATPTIDAFYAKHPHAWSFGASKDGEANPLAGVPTWGRHADITSHALHAAVTYTGEMIGYRATEVVSLVSALERACELGVLDGSYLTNSGRARQESRAAKKQARRAARAARKEVLQAEKERRLALRAELRSKAGARIDKGKSTSAVRSRKYRDKKRGGSAPPRSTATQSFKSARYIVDSGDEAQTADGEDGEHWTASSGPE